MTETKVCETLLTPPRSSCPTVRAAPGLSPHFSFRTFEWLYRFVQLYPVVMCQYIHLFRLRIATFTNQCGHGRPISLVYPTCCTQIAWVCQKWGSFRSWLIAKIRQNNYNNCNNYNTTNQYYKKIIQHDKIQWHLLSNANKMLWHSSSLETVLHGGWSDADNWPSQGRNPCNVQLPICFTRNMWQIVTNSAWPDCGD